MPAAAPQWSLDDLRAVIEQTWGYSSLRPLQEQAMAAVLDGRDSLVVLPTGGGKSLCYQAPAVYRGETTLVVSPLIALMKDQVDNLLANGVAAAHFDSTQSSGDRDAARRGLRRGEIKLLFVSPERLALSGFQDYLAGLNVRTFAIDEAHCISHWGHDFRPEYRQLRALRERFPDATVHAYTATATERVRRDIIEQLGLRDPEVLVGDFDRPNLTYRVVPRKTLLRQALEVIDRHKGEAGIVYCLSRNDVDKLAADLRANGHNAIAYHAGMDARQRTRAQDDFINEKVDIVVATVAFGMGIDRSNIRFVLHAKMPKSVEHYQQEAGRAGRDGLEAECVLLYSPGDFVSLKKMIEKSADEAQADPSFTAEVIRHLRDMNAYCQGTTCRHKALVEYFGQKFKPASCAACDLCLGDTETEPDGQVIAQKILSCVARVKEAFGAGHVAAVLRGEETERVRKLGHHELTTFGLLRDHDAKQVRDWVEQLAGQGLLTRTEDEYPVLKLTKAAWEVMRNQRQAKLLRPAKAAGDGRGRSSRAADVSWDGVDRGLFDLLAALRKGIAGERQIPPYVVFSDATLRELARQRPSTPDRMRLVYGVGAMKLRDFGDQFLDRITSYCREHGVPLDVTPGPARPAAPPPPVRANNPAYELFRQGMSVEQVAGRLGRSRGTVIEYLCDYVRMTKPADINQWLPRETYDRVAAAAREAGTTQLKPVFVHLNETVSYDDIRLVVAHLSVRAS